MFVTTIKHTATLFEIIITQEKLRKKNENIEKSQKNFQIYK